MSKIKYLSAFLLLFTAFNFISCEDIEPIDSTIVLNPDQGCVGPTSFRASDFVNGTNINLNWVAGGEEESWEIQYGISGFTVGNGTSIFSESTNLTIANLITSNDYQFYIRANCSENEVSAWVGPIAVNSRPSASCGIPTNLTATRVATDATKVNLTWTATTTSWEVQYGVSGFAIGTGTIIASNNPTLEITGLQASSSYGFYVRSVCSPTEKSAWTPVVTVAGSNSGGGGTSSGDYWPTALNNQWIYNQDGNNFTMKIIGIDNFGGLTYHKFSQQTGSGGGASATSTVWLNKNNGNYSFKIGDLNLNAGGMTGVQTGYEYIMLKDNIAVNQTWTGNYSQTTTYNGLPTSIVQNTAYTGKILEKDVTVTVNGETYPNVIKVHIKQETSIMGALSVTNTEYWFAKNGGLVNSITYSGSASVQSILLSYTLH